MASLWRMRFWFGLTNASSLGQLVGQTYRTSFAGNGGGRILHRSDMGPPKVRTCGDPLFSQINELPPTPWGKYYRAWWESRPGIIRVSYEQLTGDTPGTLKELAVRMEQAMPATWDLVEDKVGLWPAETVEERHQRE